MDDIEYDRIAGLYLDTIYRVALNGCKNPDDAEDVVQNTFFKFLRYKGQFEDDEHIRKWLIRVAINECNSIWRSLGRKKVLSLEELQTEPMVVSPEKSDLFYAVSELPSKYRECVYLYYYEEYSVKEIAQILDVSETAVRNRLMRARNKLKLQLKEA